TNLPDKYIITDSLAKLKVIFKGKGKNLFGIWASPPKAFCNLAEVVQGKNLISVRDLIIPVTDVTIDYKVKFINVEIDEKTSKYFKAIVPVKGSPKPGYAIASIEVYDTVIATGAKKFLQNLNEIYTESLDVKNQALTFERNISVKQISEPIIISPENIRIKVVIDSSSQKVFTDLRINVLKNAKQTVRIKNSTIDTLVVVGARSRLDKLHKEEINARVEVTDLVPGEYLLPVDVLLPDFCNVVNVKPQRVQIVVY
ncbi:MAG: hypothetical protein ABIL18_04535, partial [candidate division WOR-3 bacterium]